MTTQNFAFWLKGFLEIQNPSELNSKQLNIIKDHLNLVFDKITPNRYEVIPDKDYNELKHQFDHRLDNLLIDNMKNPKNMPDLSIPDIKKSKRVKIKMHGHKLKCSKTSFDEKDLEFDLRNRKIC